LGSRDVLEAFAYLGVNEQSRWHYDWPAPGARSIMIRWRCRSPLRRCWEG